MTRYGRKHQALRAWWAPKVEAGQVDCWRCHQPIQPGTPWDLGHGDGAQRDEYRGPEHASQCNRATKTHAAARRKRAKPQHPSDL